MTDQRRSALVAVLGFLQLQPTEPELPTLHSWLDNWAGVGLITVGMARQGHDLQLTSYNGQDWRANFYPVGIAHSVVEGSAWEPTPWKASGSSSSSSASPLPRLPHSDDLTENLLDGRSISGSHNTLLKLIRWSRSILRSNYILWWPGLVAASIKDCPCCGLSLPDLTRAST